MKTLDWNDYYMGDDSEFQVYQGEGYGGQHDGQVHQDFQSER